MKLDFFRTRYNKVLLESMLKQIFSTVCINENITVGQIFRKDNLPEKYKDFIFKALSEHFNLKINFRQKELFKKSVRTTDFFDK